MKKEIISKIVKCHKVRVLRMSVIVFIGLDGSGKTTLSKKLKRILESEFTVKCKYVWVKFGESIIGAILNKNKKRKTKTKMIEKSKGNPFKLTSNKFILYIYLYYLLFEHWIRIILHVRIPHMLGKTVLCDRYYFDTIVDIVVNFDFSYEKSKNISKCLIGMPKPDLIFYVKVPADIAYQRKKDIYEIDYLRDRYRIYSIFEKNPKVIVLDGTLTVGKLEKQIRDVIDSKLIGAQK